MSKIQESAKTILSELHDGIFRNLEDCEALIVANWVAVFTMSNEFADPRNVMIPQSERVRFSKENVCSDNWYIGYAKYSHEVITDLTAHRAFILVFDDEIFNCQITLFAFGKTVFISIYAPFNLAPGCIERLDIFGFNAVFPKSIGNENPLVYRRSDMQNLMDELTRTLPRLFV